LGFGFAVSQSRSLAFAFYTRDSSERLHEKAIENDSTSQTDELSYSKPMNQQDIAVEILQDPSERIIVQSLAKLDGTALGVALGLLGGLLIFAATNFLVFKGGEVIGPNLGLLAQFFPGYEVSIAGSLIGGFYGLISGFVVGWLIAFLRNTAVAIYIHILKLKSSMSAVGDYIDNP
jgi:hypothetical protein